MRPVVLSCALALATGLAPLHAQRPRTVEQAPQSAWSAVRVAKWAFLGAAVGFGAYALSRSRSADESYVALRNVCDREPERCVLQNGRYEDAELEGLYAASTAEDRRAQMGILGGQITLLGSAGLFIYDLRHHRGPDDIPYPPSRSAFTRRPGLAIGARIAF